MQNYLSMFSTTFISCVSMLKSYIISGGPQSSSSITPSWIDLLGHHKQGVSTVHFDGVNNTVVQPGGRGEHGAGLHGVPQAGEDSKERYTDTRYSCPFPRHLGYVTLAEVFQTYWQWARPPTQGMQGSSHHSSILIIGDLRCWIYRRQNLDFMSVRYPLILLWSSTL